MAFLSEATVELALLEQLRSLGYAIASDELIGPDGKQPERESHDEVVLKKRFENAVARLNAGLPLEARQDAVRRVMQSELPSLLEENRRIHKLMTEGVDVEYYANDGTLTAGKVALIDFERPEQNDWPAVSQLTVINDQNNQRPDVVVFVNGLPLSVIELKAPGSAGAHLLGAFNQLQTYKQQIAQLFNTNALLVTSDGIAARVGSLSADLERFMPWRTTDGTDVAPKGAPELSTLIEGVFEQHRLLSLLRDFTVFGETGSGLAKIIAGYHQFHAVRHAVASTIRAAGDAVTEDPADYGLPSVASQKKGDRRAGVIWHTQGSGKSLLMAFYAGQLVKHPAMANPTLVVLTDRNDLDDQLFSTFSMCRDLIRQTPVQAESRDDLQKVLSRASGGVIFTTLQKFGALTPGPSPTGRGEPLTTRRNVVVIADEAHRSQYGFKAKVDAKTGEISYGFAKYLRDALPNASFIGFTGTPIKLRPDWHSLDDNAGAVKIVMTGAASDPQDWQQHIGNKARRDLLAKRARDPKDPLKLVIVRDMWLTGFDAPCMHTMYVDKPMQGHGLMQAIARVNRVFRDKPAGLIVDYIGIAQNLKSALQQYSSSDQENTGVDEAQAIAVMMEKYEVVQDMYHGYTTPEQLRASAMSGTPQERLAMMAGAIEWILNLQQKLALSEKTKGGKKNAHRRYQDAVLALSKAFALASASDEAREIREEVGFFQAIRAALVKSSTGSGVTQQERELTIQQIVSRAVVSTEIVDILAASGLKSPDISILSDEFLAEVQQMEKKNLALEAPRKLLADGIRSRAKANVTQTKAFSERLEDAVARYHANAITTAEVLQELIQIAKDIRAARAQGEEQGLSDEEIAFYDALAENDSAIQMMGDDKLKLIAHELLVSLRENVSVDWAHRESARARMRVLVKRILRKYGYPPDLQDAAVQTVLQQAEALSSEWCVA